ncbi:GSCFA domain-containing protein [Riemerella anatipestifer]|uniref:GSCFA domain-containing protein n=1 Tax=Riemerella anatipestifer TaxID=34085 RepID=UPI00285B08F7|nr:GSCFA domain-containing protein [Riemerella anatipestifer]MDR7694778.1 GSCFA domain-containing protein [Riemerella anatipestifer]MDR7794731.1 GSCFA domain-containing protein [Riemerella anatipestifer]
MNFRTEVNLTPSSKKIEITDQVFSIGSCFASEMSNRLSEGQIRCVNNPFGTLFNPFSIANALEKIVHSEYYQEKDLVNHRGYFLSLDHHTSFDGISETTTLDKINTELANAHLFLKNASWVIITLGTSFIYEYLPTGQKVANCHKMPNTLFNKRMLSDEEVQTYIKKAIELINQHSLNTINILFTVSPVRHTKDGMVENQLSKSRLINALHQVVAMYPNAHYLPIYEILMDDLRDYRFYKSDLIHPNERAIDYIFDKFIKAYCTEDTQKFIIDNQKIISALRHRPTHTEHPDYLKFTDNLKQKIQEQQAKVNFKIFSNF